MPISSKIVAHAGAGGSHCAEGVKQDDAINEKNDKVGTRWTPTLQWLESTNTNSSEPMTLAIDCMPSESAINEAIGLREREDLKKAEPEEFKKESRASTRQPSSPLPSETHGSDEELWHVGEGLHAGIPKSMLPVNLVGLPFAAQPSAHLSRGPAALASASLTPAGMKLKEAKRQVKQQATNLSWEDGVVTVMIRQIPRQHTQLMFLVEMARCGFEGLVDFIYFPFDLKKGTNVGYGFANFTEPRHAWRFLQEFDQAYLDDDMRMKEKPLRVHPAAMQGYEANYNHFMRTKTGQKADRQFSPLFMPRGSWASLPEEVQRELAMHQQAWERKGRPQLTAADCSSGFEAAESVDAAEGAWQPSSLGAHSAGAWLSGGSEAQKLWGQTPASEAPMKVPNWQRIAAKVAPSQVSATSSVPRPPSAHAASAVTPPGLRRETDPWQPPAYSALSQPPTLPAGLRAAHATGPELHGMASHAGLLGAPPSMAPHQDYSSTYRHLEEQRLKLLSELALVEEEQRRTLLGSLGGVPQLPPNLLSFLP